MLDQTLSLPEDPEELRSFTARLLAEVIPDYKITKVDDLLPCHSNG